MRAIVVEGGIGPAEALQLADAPTPRTLPGEVLIRVAGAGVNYADILQRRGRYPPPAGAPDTIGLEVSGTIACCAPGGRFQVDDQVCALLGGGGYAEYVAVDARHVLPVPAGVSLVDAGGLPEAVFTVFANVFERGELKADETFLVHGATSGIGVTAISMAKAAGARVISTSRGADKARWAQELGADVAIDSTAEDFVETVRREGGADVVLDMVGGEYTQRNLDCLRPDGRLSQIAFQAGTKVTLDLRDMLARRLTFTGSGLRTRSADDKARLATRVEEIVWPWLASGAVRVHVDRRYPLAEAASAHRLLESGKHIGKVLLSPQIALGNP